MNRMVLILTTILLVIGCVSAPETGAKTSRPALDGLLPEMVRISGGTFTMGDSAEEGDGNEIPVHSVTVGDFAISKFEVTFDLYDVFVSETGRRKPEDEGWGRGQRPAINISWHDATALAQWLTEKTGRAFRLPTESEWEYAARAGSDAVYPQGNTLTRDYANYGPTDCCAKGPGKSGADQFGYTAPVGSFKANPWGLHDMLGNAWEWTADCWNETYQGAPTDGSAWNTGDCERSPLRSGSWTHYSRNIRPANRNENLRVKFGNGYGVRLAEDLTKGK